jgi:hypothetical protein
LPGDAMLVSDYVAIGVLIVSTALLGAKWWFAHHQ